MTRRYVSAAWFGLLALLVVSAAPSGVTDVFEKRPDGSRYDRYAVPEDDLYKSPVQLCLSRDGRTLFAACEGTNEVLKVDVRRRRVVSRVTVGSLPFAMVTSPDGNTLYVGNRGDESVSVVDVRGMRETGRIRVGDDPHGLALVAGGSRLFVANLGTNDLSIVDVGKGTEVKRLRMGTGPFDLAVSPDEGTIYVTNQLSSPVPFRTPPVPELTVIDAASGTVRERRNLDNTVVVQGVDVSPDGRFVAAALEVPKNLVPQTQIYQGWMVTHGFALTETRPGGRTVKLLLDEPNLYYADPYGIGFSPDGRRLYVSSSGANMVTVVDMERALSLCELREGKISLSKETIQRYGRHLGLSAGYVVARVPTGSNPKDLVVSPDGRRVYVAERLADRITVIDAETNQALEPIDLGGPSVITTLRKGARLFNFASISFHRQLSCATCHPENLVDGLQYDIAADGGMGHNLVDNRSLRGIAETAPFKWSGKNPTLERQEGPRAAQLFFRTQGFEGDEREAVVRFIESIPLRPNRYRHEGRPLTEFEQMGKKLFERAYDNLGNYIPVANRCITCHPPPHATDRMKHDVGSKGEHDLDGLFDSCNLNNIYQQAPFMHDGRCYSLEEIWTRFNPDDTHGVTNDMTKDQLNALIEYVKTL